MNDSNNARSEKLISFGEVLRALRPVRWTLLTGAMIGALAGFSVSEFIRPIYRSQVTMLPAKSPDAPGGIASQVGGIAALAGINLGGNDNQVESYEYLKSRILAETFITSQDMLPLLFPSLWDPVQHQWRQDKHRSPPTMAEALRKVRNRVIRITQDKVSGLVGVNIEWSVPSLARDWANDFVRMANDELRKRAITESEGTVAYLSREINNTASVPVREALSKVMETQLRTLALAKVREDYAFRVLDHAGLPDKDDIVRPQRAVYVGGGLILGAVLFLWIHRRFFKKPINDGGQPG